MKPSIKISACQETYREHVQVYTCVTDDAIRINPEEISEGAFFDLAKIQEEISVNSAKFTSSFKLLFNQSLLKENSLVNENESSEKFK